MTDSESPQSEEIKSKSGTSISDKLVFKQKLNSFQYPTMPKRSYYSRNKNIRKIRITTNLFELKLKEDYHKFILFNSDIDPEVAEDNSPLRKEIYLSIVIPNLPKCYKKIFWAGKNIYAFIKESTNYDYEILNIHGKLNNIEYKIILKKVKEIYFQKVRDFNGANQQIKSVLEILFRNLIKGNPKIIAFHDRTIFEIDPKKIISIDNKNKDNIYQGYFSSCQITENGLYMLINNRNKLISGKTALQKMIEIRKELQQTNIPINEIYERIKEYFKYHKTVLTIYGSLRTYKIKDVDFDKKPENT